MKKSYRNKKFIRNVTLFGGSLALFTSGVLIFFLFSMKIPDFRSFEDRKVSNSTQIYDRTGEILLYDIHQNIKRTSITWEKIGANIKNATVAIEDSEFYNHSGVRLTSTVRAVLSNLFGIGRTQGGSTITQQLVKNTLLTQKKTYVRKIKEWILAIKIEQALSKEKILEYYLNEVPYGGTVYGIEAAANTYFNKRAADLTLAEAAYLAAIPQSPTILSPYGKNRDRLETRKNLVLNRMLELGFITKIEYESAKNEVINFVPSATAGIRAPHFVFFIREYLEEKYGADMVENGGLKVITTLNAELQAKAEEIVKTGALENEKTWNGKNAALVALDPKTGQILTMVGSRDYFDKMIDGNFNVATAVRQPGSSFKPFIYATAFNKGFTQDTVLFDVPTEFQSTCDPYGRARSGHSQDECYTPENYDGNFRGPMKLRDALAQSINVVAVKLFYLSGLSDSLRTAENMGISTLGDPGRYGLTLVIGGGEVSLLDMTSAYGVLANNGVRNPYSGILRIEDRQGEVLEEWTPAPREVLPKNTALLLSDILSDNDARAPTFGANSPLYLPGRDVAVKTGTTNSNRDAWTLGYTPSIAVGVWAGNNDNLPMKRGGSAVAGPIWNKFMNEALKTLPTENFEEPDLSLGSLTLKPVFRGFWQGNESFFVDKISGKLATADTPPETREEKVITNVHTILYWVDRNDILGPPPTDPTDNYQFNNWETAVQNWWAQNQNKYNLITWSQKPLAADDVHTDSRKPDVGIASPRDGASYSPEERVYLSLSSSGSFPLQKVDIFINDRYLESLTPPFNFSFVPKDLDNLETVNELRIVYYDTVYNRGEATTSFRIVN